MAGIESLLVGRTLGGRYRIEEVIGRGGMGAVYRALDERLGRHVAIKVITVADSGEPDARDRLRARFFREARSAAALPHHPNVVPVYDYGSDEAIGLDYIVMELLRGSDLASRLARGGPPQLAASVKILLEAARGVAVGHRQGLIHRDIKPGNIFLTEPHRNEVQVRVVDFGIAKLTDDDDTLAQLTQDGRVPHSPAYASPEQLRGLSNLTPASDVFSLGAVGYQLLTGERPFSESDRNRLSLGMAVEAPPLRTKNPAIPSPIQEVIRKALAYEPADRFADASEMAAALEHGMRSLGDLTVEPYLAGAAIVTGAPNDDLTQPLDDDDRTRLMGEAEDDRTLLAPSPTTRVGAAPRAPARPPPGQQRRERRGLGGLFVWALVILVLLVAAVWAFNEIQRQPAAFEVTPPPDSIPIVPPDEPIDVDADPVDPELAAFYANAEGRRHFESEAFDSALVEFSRAVELAPLSPDYRRNYGLTLLQRNAPEEAARQLTRAIELAPDRPESYESLSRAQLILGDTAAAIGSLTEYAQRERNVARRVVAERRIDMLEGTQEPDLPPLLGERVRPDSAAPAVPDTLPATTPVPPPVQRQVQ